MMVVMVSVGRSVRVVVIHTTNVVQFGGRMGTTRSDGSHSRRLNHD
jgi:hypothetical protein